MKRLTKKVDGVWTALCKYGNSPFPIVTQEIIDRLAAYEDTGLTPEEVQQMQWIPVKERMPDAAGEYLVVYRPCHWDSVSEKICVGIDSFRGKAAWAKKKYQRVTHWMPLPAAPKEEKK